MQKPQRDHGVAGKTHWLLDEELVPRGPMRVARPLPVLLRHDEGLEPTGERATEAPARSSDAFRFALGLLAALAIYLLLRAADVGGAMQGSVPTEGDEGSVVVTATPEARLERAETAALRALLGRVPPPDVAGPMDPASPSTSVDQQAPKQPTAEVPVLPLQPPAPLPAPDSLTLLPEVPQARKVMEDLERATGLEPATLSLEG
jgi:hypothetical protein